MILQIVLLYLALVWFLKNFLTIQNSFVAASVVTLMIISLALMENSALGGLLFIDQHSSLITVILLILGIIAQDLKIFEIKLTPILLSTILSDFVYFIRAPVFGLVYYPFIRFFYVAVVIFLYKIQKMSCLVDQPFR